MNPKQYFSMLREQERTSGENTPPKITSAQMQSAMRHLSSSRQDNTAVNNRVPDPSVKPGSANTSVIGNTGLSRVIGLAPAQYLGQRINMMAKFLPGDRELIDMKVSEKDLSRKQRDILYRAAEKKAKESGKNRGIIGYEDLAAMLPEDQRQELLDSTKGKKGQLSQALRAMFDPVTDIALSLGNFTYDKQDDGNIKLYDEYDFINSSNVVKDESGKQSLKKDWVSAETRGQNGNTEGFFDRHDKLTEYDLWAKENRNWNNRKADITLTPQDTVIKPGRLRSVLGAATSSGMLTRR